MNNQKVMVIDGNSIINRAFFGLQGTNLLATSDGLYTNALYGFMSILLKFLDEEKPEYVCVAFDLKAPTYRHKEYDGYKAHRKGMPEELAVQMPVLKQLLDAMNISRVEQEGYEADDILGTISRLAGEARMDCVVLTGDRDSMQLASEQCRIKIPITRSGITETEEYDHSRIGVKYGVTPEQMIDVKGLMGDASDNIPGVPGIGEKTALDLIRTYGSLEGVYEHIDEIKTRKNIKENLVNFKEQAFMSKRLATIDRHVPGIDTVEPFKRREFNREALYRLLKRLEFKSFIEKLQLQEEGVKPASEDSLVRVECLKDQDEINGLFESLKAQRELAFYFLFEQVDSFHSKLAACSFTYEGRTFFFRIGDCISEELFLSRCRSILEDGECRKYSHNVKSVLVYLKKHGIEPRGIVFDTMIGAYILNPSRENYNLDGLAGEFLGKNLPSLEELSGKGKSAIPYHALDDDSLSRVLGGYSGIIPELYKFISEKIKEYGQEKLLYEIELPLVEVLANMEYWGFKVDPDKLKELSAILDEKIDALIKTIYAYAGEEFNINSTKQLGVILFEKLNLPVIKKTKTGYSTDAEVLEMLAPKHEMVSSILEYRQLVKLKSTYVEGLISVIHPETGKIHSSFNQTVTMTGRISSTEPNLQNIPIKLELGREIRKVFIASSEEYLLADADYSQIELRVLAHITGDPNMTEAFKNNLDIHRMTASQVFGIPQDQVTPLMRSRAKAVNFGIVYGIGDFSLSKDLGITRKEAKKYIDGYLEKYQNVKQYMHDTVETGSKEGFVTTMFNRRRYLPELKSKNANIRSFGERVAMNTPIQGSAADIIKIAMVNVYRELKERGMKSRLILQVHDELIVETEKTEKALVETILKNCMEKAVRMNVPLVAELKFGSNWYETK